MNTLIRPNIEAEMSVLCCMFLNDKTVQTIMGEVSADDFKYLPNREVFEICRELFMANKPIDVITVGEKYGHNNHLIEVVNAVPITANIKHHIKAVKDRAMRINAETAAHELLKLLDDEDISDCQTLAGKITSSLTGDNSNDVVNMQDAINNFRQTKREPREYIRTGFSTLDTYTFIEKGDFVVLGGRPSAGKTAFTLQMGLNMAANHKVVYFSLETKPDKIFDRVFSNLAEISLSQIKTGGDALKAKEWTRHTEQIGNMLKLDFKVVKASGMTVQQIKSKAIELKADVVFIDYLSLIQSQGKNMLEKVGNISIGLHNMAQQMDLTVIALSQLSREGKNEPDMTHLRESGQIEQDADLILLIYQPDEKKPDRELIIAKNKEGRTGKVRFRFEGIYQKFWEMMDR